MAKLGPPDRIEAFRRTVVADQLVAKVRLRGASGSTTVLLEELEPAILGRGWPEGTYRLEALDGSGSSIPGHGKSLKAQEEVMAEEQALHQELSRAVQLERANEPQEPTQGQGELVRRQEAQPSTTQGGYPTLRLDPVEVRVLTPSEAAGQASQVRSLTEALVEAQRLNLALVQSSMRYHSEVTAKLLEELGRSHEREVGAVQAAGAAAAESAAVETAASLANPDSEGTQLLREIFETARHWMDLKAVMAPKGGEPPADKPKPPPRPAGL